MKLYYDLHIHSALSPCADNDNTPNNIVGMASIKGLNVIAVADHNSILNVGATVEAAKQYGIMVLPGLEMTTAEDIHLLCLFASMTDAERFFSYAKKTMHFIDNDEKIFGEQLILNEDDEIIGREEKLLIYACDMGIYEAVRKVQECGGAAVPAHIDKQANSILASLGEVPCDLGVKSVEMFKNGQGIPPAGYKVVRNSDAHYLEDISEAENFFEVEEFTAHTIINYLNTL